MGPRSFFVGGHWLLTSVKFLGILEELHITGEIISLLLMFCLSYCLVAVKRHHD